MSRDILIQPGRNHLNKNNFFITFLQENFSFVVDFFPRYSSAELVQSSSTVVLNFHEISHMMEIFPYKKNRTIWRNIFFRARVR